MADRILDLYSFESIIRADINIPLIKYLMSSYYINEIEEAQYDSLHHSLLRDWIQKQPTLALDSVRLEFLQRSHYFGRTLELSHHGIQHLSLHQRASSRSSQYRDCLHLELVGLPILRFITLFRLSG